MERLPIQPAPRENLKEQLTKPKQDELELDLNLEKLDLTYSSGEPRVG
jgi:hypothetical protein